MRLPSSPTPLARPWPRRTLLATGGATAPALAAGAVRAASAMAATIVIATLLPGKEGEMIV